MYIFIQYTYLDVSGNMHGCSGFCGNIALVGSCCPGIKVTQQHSAISERNASTSVVATATSFVIAASCAFPSACPIRVFVLVTVLTELPMWYENGSYYAHTIRGPIKDPLYQQ